MLHGKLCFDLSDVLDIDIDSTQERLDRKHGQSKRGTGIPTRLLWPWSCPSTLGSDYDDHKGTKITLVLLLLCHGSSFPPAPKINN